MSSHSFSDTCPICNESMDACNSNKPFENVSGECLHCGFSYYTKCEQMSLEDINYLREDFNENNEDEKKLKPITKKEYKKWEKEINKI